MASVATAERGDCTRARVREEYVDVTMFRFHDGIEPVQIFRRDTSPTTVVTFLLMKAAASFSSFSRRPVITTAHLLPRSACCGQANPAASACDNRNFAANFCLWLLLICFLLFVVVFFYVEFTLFLQSSHSRRLLLLLEQILEDELTQVRRVRAPARHPR